MTTTSKLLGGIGAAVIAAGGIWLAVNRFVPAPPPADICTGAYFYQRSCDGQWFAAWPNSIEPGRTYQGCSAHDWGVSGEDGKWYFVRAQYAPPDQGNYKIPPDSAPSAQASWRRCYDPPHAFEGGNSYSCDTAQRLSGIQNIVMKTLAQVPEPMKHSFVALYGCGGPVTPAPTAPPGPVPTPPGPCPCPCTPGPVVTAPVRTPTRPPAPNPTRTRPPNPIAIDRNGLAYVEPT